MFGTSLRLPVVTRMLLHGYFRQRKGATGVCIICLSYSPAGSYGVQPGLNRGQRGGARLCGRVRPLPENQTSQVSVVAIADSKQVCLTKSVDMTLNPVKPGGPTLGLGDPGTASADPRHPARRGVWGMESGIFDDLCRVCYSVVFSVFISIQVFKYIYPTPLYYTKHTVVLYTTLFLSAIFGALPDRDSLGTFPFGSPSA